MTNFSAVAFLVSDKVRAVRVSYEENGKEYTFKTQDQSLVKNDLVIVPTNTRHGFTVCKVIELDVDVDFENPAIEYKWIAGKIDKTAYDTLLKQEETMLAEVRQAETRKKREQLRATMFANQEALANLPLLGTDVPAPETPPKA